MQVEAGRKQEKEGKTTVSWSGVKSVQDNCWYKSGIHRPFSSVRVSSCSRRLTISMRSRSSQWAPCGSEQTVDTQHEQNRRRTVTTAVSRCQHIWAQTPAPPVLLDSDSKGDNENENIFNPRHWQLGYKVQRLSKYGSWGTQTVHVCKGLNKAESSATLQKAEVILRRKQTSHRFLFPLQCKWD